MIAANRLAPPPAAGTDPARAVAALNHALLAELLRLGLEVGGPVASVADAEACRLRTVLIVYPHQGGPGLTAADVVKRLGQVPAGPVRNRVGSEIHLTRTESAVLAACDHETPLPATTIARRAGKRPMGSYVRTCLAKLIDLDLVRHVRGGYVRVRPPEDQP